jgi:hypothetical protein
VTDTPAERGAESTGVRLRRRKVVQWGVIYVAGGWGLLQGFAYVSTIFHWSEQLQRLATLGLVAALPIVLVLAWYHGDRGQQRISTPELAILTVLLLLGGGANRLLYLPAVLEASGRQIEAERAQNEQIEYWADDAAFLIAQNYAYRGDPALALKWLERAYVQRDTGLGEIVGEPLFKSMYADPRYKAFLRKMKLPEPPSQTTAGGK